ncbi:hypothetical protein BGZ83_004143, partial [Gryganskiella cystojenkinii]
DGPMLGPYTADRETFRRTVGLEDQVEFDKAFERFGIVDKEKVEEDQRVIAYFKDGILAVGRLLIGADSIYSLVRHQVLQDLKLVDTTIESSMARPS